MNIWNRLKGRFTEMCKDLDDEIVYLDDYDEDIKEIKSEAEPREPSIVLSK